MTALIYLIPVSVGLGLVALAGFIWSVGTRQYDNMESDAYRILDVEDVPLDEAQSTALRKDCEHW